MKKIKTIFLVTIVFAMVQSCIPNDPVVNPVLTSGTFNVNINSLRDSVGYNLYGEKKILWIDDDSIGFQINQSFNPGFSILSFTIGTKSSAGNSYEFYNNTLDDSVQMSYLSAGINVTHLDTVKWIPSFVVPNGLPTTQFTFDGFDRVRQIYEGTILTIPVMLHMPENTNKYFVFRKQKGSSYMYYWVKANVSYNAAETKNYGYTVNILDGKYQMDSIITGQ